MALAAKASFAGRIFEGARRIFRNPFVRATALTLGVGLFGACSDKGRVMEAPNDGKGGWDLAAETYARNNLQLGNSPRVAEISTALKGCFALTNDVSIAPKDIVIAEAGKDKIYPPDKDCVSAVMALATGETIPVPTVATPEIAPVAPTECGPFTLPPLDKIVVEIAELARRTANPVTIPLPEGFTVKAEELDGMIFVPQGMVDLRLSDLALNEEGTALTGNITPQSGFHYSATVPIIRTFELSGTRQRVLGETANGALITEEVAPLLVDISIIKVKAAQGGGGHHGGGGSTPAPGPSLTPPGSIRDAILGNSGS